MKEKKRKHSLKDREGSSSIHHKAEENEVNHEAPESAADRVDESLEHNTTNVNDDEDDAAVDDETAEPPSLKRRKRKKKQKTTSKTPNTSDTPIQTNTMEPVLSDAEKMNHVEYTIYVEGLPFDCTDEEVQEFFISHGCSDVLQLRLPKWQDTGRLRGYGHVVFQSIHSCQKAIQELNRKTLKTRYLTIQAAHTPKSNTGVTSSSSTNPPIQPMGCKTIFVKNLPYEDCFEQDLERIFTIYGKIIEGGVRVARNSQTRQSKGFAYIEFKNPEGALAAVSTAYKKGIQIQNRPCIVDYDVGRVKESFRTAGGQFWKREFSPKDTTHHKKSTRK
jgi:nucleolin